jgi:septal ring factor EnvC (AmiA/AmiB activator)
LSSWINLNKTVKKLKFRTISELTKRFYVEKKQTKQAKIQDKISNDEKETNWTPRSINAEFDKIQEDLNNLKKKNKDLKSL